MTVVDERAGIYTSFVNATTSWRRAAVQEIGVPAHTVYDWDADPPHALGVERAGFSDAEVSGPIPFTPLLAEHNGSWEEITSGRDFYEDVHVAPKVIDVGLVASETSVVLEIFNAFRRTPKTWRGWVNRAGAGVDLDGDPATPHVYDPFDGSGDSISLVISAEGDPVVDAILDFVWTGHINLVRLIFSRVVPLATTSEGLLLPEDEYREELRFLTDVLEKATGEEQRISLRKNPRQFFHFNYMVRSEAERAELDVLLTNLQHLLFAVPIFYESVALTAAATAGDTEVFVGATAYSDFRELSAAVIYSEDGTFDMRGVETVNANSIVFSTALVNDYPAGARVAPVRSGWISPTIEGARFPVNASTFSASFQVRDNDVDLADASAFASYDGKPLVDEVIVRGTTRSGMTRRVDVIDSEVGRRSVRSSWLQSKATRDAAFAARSPAGLRDIRGLLHALRGRQVSFWLPTKRPDMTIVEDVLATESTIVINFIGYAANGLGIPRADVIRLTMADGTVYYREIIDAEVVGGANELEELTLDSEFSLVDDLPAEDFVLVEFVQKVRLESDDVTLLYERGSRTVLVPAPVLEVLE